MLGFAPLAAGPLAALPGATGQAGIVGTGNATFAPMTSAAVAEVSISAGAASTFAPMTGAASARLSIVGNGAATFAPMTGGAAGALAIDGDAIASFAPLTGVASARLRITATASATFAPMTGAASGGSGALEQIEGSGAATFAPMTGTARGRVGRTAPVRFLSFRVEPKALSFSVEAKRLNFTVDADGALTVEAMDNKIVSEVWVCGLDLTPWKEGGREVIAVRHEPVAGSIEVDDVALVDADNATFTVSGGTRKGTAQFDIMGDLSDGCKFGKRFQVTCI